MTRTYYSHHRDLRKSDSDVQEVEAKHENYIILFRTSLRNTVFDVLKNRKGWRETDTDAEWDFNWTDIGWIRDNYDHMQFEEHQRVNHFRNHYELTRKDLLVKNLKRMRRTLERSDGHFEAAKYNFFPATYVLPSEYGIFLEDFKRTAGSTWIMKPIGRAQGKGIFLFNKLSQISEWKKDHKWKSDAPQAESYVAQRYVDRPYTIGGKKFDLRLYVLVTSFSPLTVWIHRAGFARFSNSRYSTDKSTMTNSYIHLTNYSVQKKAKDYNQEQDCKWSIDGLKLYLMSKHGRSAVERLFAEMQDMIIRSLLSVQQTIIQDKHSFELYGYDVLIDENLKPWLIEVNSSPSLTGSGEEDYKLKYDVVNDMVDIIDIEGNLTGEEFHVGGFDLAYDGGFIGEDLVNHQTSYSRGVNSNIASNNVDSFSENNNIVKQCMIGCYYRSACEQQRRSKPKRRSKKP